MKDVARSQDFERHRGTVASSWIAYSPARARAVCPPGACSVRSGTSSFFGCFRPRLGERARPRGSRTDRSHIQINPRRPYVPEERGNPRRAAQPYVLEGDKGQQGTEAKIHLPDTGPGGYRGPRTQRSTLLHAARQAAGANREPKPRRTHRHRPVSTSRLQSPAVNPAASRQTRANREPKPRGTSQTLAREDIKAPGPSGQPC